jgi:hypothetical protein
MLNSQTKTLASFRSSLCRCTRLKQHSNKVLLFKTPGYLPTSLKIAKHETETETETETKIVFTWWGEGGGYL